MEPSLSQSHAQKILDKFPTVTVLRVSRYKMIRDKRGL
jgi:hypothetical protein